MCSLSLISYKQPGKNRHICWLIVSYPSAVKAMTKFCFLDSPLWLNSFTEWDENLSFYWCYDVKKVQVLFESAPAYVHTYNCEKILWRRRVVVIRSSCTAGLSEVFCVLSVSKQNIVLLSVICKALCYVNLTDIVNWPLFFLLSFEHLLWVLRASAIQEWKGECLSVFSRAGYHSKMFNSKRSCACSNWSCCQP